MAFHLHADAAWGGYAAAITRDTDGNRRSYESTREEGADVWPEEGVYNALCALEKTDSVTIDPHKLGFIPYPAGAISFSDRRVRDLVAVEAPYLFHRGASEWGYIGRFIFEGSKPGAAAAGVWMSHKVLPLNATGYGRLVGKTAHGARLLHKRLIEGDFTPFSTVLLPLPDLNIVCFALGHPSLESLDANNAFVDRIYNAMSAGEGRSARQLDYFVTKTVLRTGQYGRAALPLIEELGFTEAEFLESDGLSVIRCTVMDPFMDRSKTNYIDGFAENLKRVMSEQI